MSHVRLWRFVVPPEREARFIAAYGPDGDWARLFGEARGYLRTELWRGEDGSFLTADHWRSSDDFEEFQANLGPHYHALDAQLEGLASEEVLIGAFDTA
jgi:heme-degrading monooxygenase HmoA